MRNKKQQIIFKEASNAAQYILDIPKPATTTIPNWYKNQKLFSNHSNDVAKAKNENAFGTYKLCVPFVDALTAGYYFVTTSDLIVKNIGEFEYVPYIEWNVDWIPVDIQDNETLGNFPIPHDHNKTSFRWYSDWQIVTPKGYSVWITHPSNRFDLPFTTLNAFIDTDKHPNKILIPFFVKNNFEGIIPAGTPVAQIIPIKRDSWISKRAKYEKSTEFIGKNIMKINFIRVYKKMFWSKKEYR